MFPARDRAHLLIGTAVRHQNHALVVAAALLATIHTCSPLGGYRPNSTGDWTRLGAARTTVHELLHAIGASSPCGPDYLFGNHVSDERDIMYPTDVTDRTGVVVAGGASVLDAGNDDYRGRAYAVCFGSPQPDVALSPFLHAPS